MTPRLSTDRPELARVERLLDLFLLKRENADCAAVTIADYRRAVRHFLLFDGTPPDPRDWRDEHIELWLSALRHADLKTGTRAWYQRHLFAFIGFLVEREETGTNTRGNPIDPRKGVLRIKPENVRRRWADTDVITRLLTVAITSRNPARNAAIIHALRATGARRNELAHCTVDDLNLEDEVEPGITWPTLRLRVTKTRVERKVPLDGPAHAAMLEWLLVRGNEPGALFTSERTGPLTGEGIKQVIDRLAARAKVQASSHDFRRAFAATARRRGLDIAHVQRLLGHSTITMSLVYSEEGEDDAAISAYRRLMA